MLNSLLGWQVLGLLGGQVSAPPHIISAPALTIPDGGFPGDDVYYTPGAWSGADSGSAILLDASNNVIALFGFGVAGQYTIAPADSGLVLHVLETAYNDNAPDGVTAISNTVTLETVPVNTVAPAIDPDPVIGTPHAGDDGTWTLTPSLTYQWQHLIAGVWADISGATSKNYDTPVDADFGYPLRLEVTPDGGGLPAYSNVTNSVVETVTQTHSTEKLGNNDFALWGAPAPADNPQSPWSITGELTGDPEVTERDTGTGHAASKTTGGSANFYASATANQPRATQSGVIANGDIIESYVQCSYAGSGTMRLEAGTNIVPNFTTTGKHKEVEQSNSTSIILRSGGSAPLDMTIDEGSVRVINKNSALTQPDADGQLEGYFTIPVTPEQGDQYWLIARASNFASGNYWFARYVYTGAQWNINLYSVATKTRTSRIAATNIGTINGIRLTFVGNDWTLETTTDGGDNWNSVGTHSNSLYNDAAICNALASENFTLSDLVWVDQSAAALVPAQEPPAVTFPVRAATYHVTNLNDSGVGSLRYALEADEDRDVVFDVAGTIELDNSPTGGKSRIYPKSGCNIKGGTAPNGGICLKGGLYLVDVHDFYAQHLRIRTDPLGYDPKSLSPIVITGACHDLLLDHLSCSWGVDGLITVSTNHVPGAQYNLKIQWCILSEALNDSTHPDGAHSAGVLISAGWDNVQLHHNILAHIDFRAPTIYGEHSGYGNVEFVNNILYHTNELPYFSGYLQANLYGNYRKMLGGRTEYVDWKNYPLGTAPETESNLYFADNLVDEDGSIRSAILKADPGGYVYNYVMSLQDLGLDAFDAYSALQSYIDVLAYAGAVSPARDSIDSRIISEIQNGTGFIPDDPGDVGGWVDLTV